MLPGLLRRGVRAIDIPDVVGSPVLGWRVWILDEELGLGSIMKSVWWPYRKPFRATCISPHKHPVFTAHESPLLGSKCPCGIYAVKTLSDANGYIANFTNVGISRAVGLVSLWGKIVEGTEGWRAQFAYPKHVWVLKNVIRVGVNLWSSALGGPQRIPVAHLERPYRVADMITERYGVPADVIPGGTPYDVTMQLAKEREYDGVF